MNMTNSRLYAGTLAVVIIGFLTAGLTHAQTVTTPDNKTKGKKTKKQKKDGKKDPSDSPVLIAGGSTHFIDKDSPAGTPGGWTVISGGCNAGSVAGDVDHCSYSSANPVSSGNILITGASAVSPANAPLTIKISAPWFIDIKARKDNGGEDNADIYVCSGTPTGPACDPAKTPTSGAYAVLTPYNNGFYFEDNTNKKDKRYHTADVYNIAACPNGHCEEMNKITLTMGGSTYVYKCIASIGCSVQIGN